MNKKSAYFAGGCFWCITPTFKETNGVFDVISGYCGGDEANPTYYEVKHQKTSHKECIKIVYDEDKVSFEQILKIYFEHINPYDDGGQFIDRGDSYTTAIFYRDENMYHIARNYIDGIENEFKKMLK